MRILFIYSIQKSITRDKPLLGQEGIYFGISLLSALLKKQGYLCDLAVLDRRHKLQNNIRIVSKKIESFKPDVVSFTAVHSEFDFICNAASRVKGLFPHLFLYAGGVHITLNPDEKYLEIFDAFCVGEGEYPTLELIRALETGEDISNIPNLWVKSAGVVTKNACRPFIENLDELPFPDRDIWQPWILNPDTRFSVLVGRGCPFNCTYCCNHQLRKISRGKYVRFRSPENVIAEIRDLHERFPNVDEVYLEVETLGVDLKWVDVFCEKLRQFGEETGFALKFGTNLRIFPSLNIDFVFGCFKKANITSVTIGLESGSYRIRKEILNRDYSNEIILQAAQTAKKYDIDIALFNMVGLPTETPLEFSETLGMNQTIQPSFHATSIFFPYQGTKLYTICEQMGLLPANLETKDERQIARLNLPGFSRKQIQRSFDSFHYNVYKQKEGRSALKLAVYYSMQYLGHNFYANLKIFVIRLLHNLRNKRFLNRDFFSIFQKSK